MPEQAPQLSPDVIQASIERRDELQAYAMKPEEDRMAADRDAAPIDIVGSARGEDGVIRGVEGPVLTPVQEAEHKVRKSFANRDAERALDFDNEQHDSSKDTRTRMAARAGLMMLTSTTRKPRPNSDIERHLKK